MPAPRSPSLRSVVLCLTERRGDGVVRTAIRGSDACASRSCWPAPATAAHRMPILTMYVLAVRGDIVPRTAI